ncbi:MAG: hypothetical protein GTO30_09205 [Acidobacteria bacterium]|nr:hypothetical protein [Acidobacteriota bacterium]NIO60183.1 hypothetical protein [Acidobacteriota bacterium]NIQ86394.1 hypothetical protein [Acidobacteriota bacterium]
MNRRFVLWVVALGWLLAALPVDAGAFEDAVRARWRGAWIVTEIETYSVCNGNYFNNDVSGQFVAARAGRPFQPGELAKVDKLQVNRKKIELMVTIAGMNLVPWQDGPFTLYDQRTCRIELEVAVPRSVIKAKNVAEVDRLLATVARRFATRDEAMSSSDWNGREADEYPADYERTLAYHAVWRAEETNRVIDEQMDGALLTANELAREVDGNPEYLAGFAYGARMMREWRERDCRRLIGSTAVTFRLKAPDEYSDNTTWCAGFYDGQALVYNLAVLSRLPACYVEVPELPAEYADAAVGRR